MTATRALFSEWQSARSDGARARLPTETRCPVCGVANQVCTEDPLMVELAGTTGVQDLPPGMVEVDEDVFEEFYYPGSQEKGRRLKFSRGSIVKEQELSDAKEASPSLTRSDQMVLDAATSHPNDEDTEAELLNPHGLIAGSHTGTAGPLGDEDRGLEDAFEPPTEEEPEVGVAPSMREEDDDPERTETVPNPERLDASTAAYNAGLGDGAPAYESATTDEGREQAATPFQAAGTDGQYEGLLAGSVSDVTAYLEEHPDERDAVVAAENAGKQRKGITGS